jgi:hypothetical protein
MVLHSFKIPIRAIPLDSTAPGSSSGAGIELSPGGAAQPEILESRQTRETQRNPSQPTKKAINLI